LKRKLKGITPAGKLAEQVILAFNPLKEAPEKVLENPVL